ncbi:MAG: endonuclease/exonuclease/phosphatase family protein [Altererythrobacter sp.]
MRLTFASYNIHKAVGTDGRRDADRIIAVLREIDADIIALQEVDRRIGERATVLSRAALDDTPWKPAALARRPRSLGWHGNAILVRRDFEVLEEVAMELPTLEPRGAVRVDVSCLGHRIRILGTHLDLSGLRRRDQIRAILSEVGDCSPPVQQCCWVTSTNGVTGPGRCANSGRTGMSSKPGAASPVASRSRGWTGSSPRASGAALSRASTTAHWLRRHRTTCPFLPS